MQISPSKKQKLKSAFNPDLHPRYPKGHPQGGKFMPKGSADYKAAIAEAKTKGKQKNGGNPKAEIKKLSEKLFTLISGLDAGTIKGSSSEVYDLNPDIHKVIGKKEFVKMANDLEMTQTFKQQEAINKYVTNKISPNQSPAKQKTPSTSKPKASNLNPTMEGDSLGVFSEDLDEAATLLSSLTGTTKERGEQMAHSIEAFSRHHDSRIRKAQREGKGYNLINKDREEGEDLEVDYDVIDALNEYLDKAPKYKGVIYRGLNFTNKMAGEKFMKELQSAGGYTQREHSSFSADRGVAERFAIKGVVAVSVVLSVPNKSGVGIKRFSHFPNEDEVLSSAGTKYRIKNIKKESSQGSDHYDVELEEVLHTKVAERREQLKKAVNSK